MRCVKCDGRLGVQNPGYLCDTCKWIKSHDRTVTITGTSEPGSGTRYEVICSLMDDSDGYPRVAEE